MAGHAGLGFRIFCSGFRGLGLGFRVAHVPRKRGDWRNGRDSRKLWRVFDTSSYIIRRQAKHKNCTPRNMFDWFLLQKHLCSQTEVAQLEPKTNTWSV